MTSDEAVDPAVARMAQASDERLVVLSQRRLTRYSRRLLEAEAARRGVALHPVDDEGFPVRSSASDKAAFGEYPCRYDGCTYIAPYRGVRAAHEAMQHEAGDS